MKSAALALWLAAAAFAQQSGASALLDAEARFAQAAAERGAEGFIAFFAENASILPAKAPVVTGLSALREIYTKAWATPGFSLTWKPLKAEVSRSGELGYTFGTYERRHTADGKMVLETGKYMTIWRRQPDGSWKVIADMGN